MRSGLQSSFAVHVYDSTVSPVGTLTSIAPERDSLTLNVGESGQVLMTLTPGNSRPMLSFASSDDAVAVVDDWFGIVTAVQPGQCAITVTDSGTGLQAEYAVVVEE